MAYLTRNKLYRHHCSLKKPKTYPLGMLPGYLYRIQKGSGTRPPGKDGRLNGRLNGRLMAGIHFHSLLRLHWIYSKGFFLSRHVKMRTLEEEIASSRSRKGGESGKWLRDLRNSVQVSYGVKWEPVQVLQQNSRKAQVLEASSTSGNMCEEDAKIGRVVWTLCEKKLWLQTSSPASGSCVIVLPNQGKDWRFIPWKGWNRVPLFSGTPAQLRAMEPYSKQGHCENR